MRRKGALDGILHVGRLPAVDQPLVLKKGDPVVLSNKLALGRGGQETGEDGRVLRPATINCTIPEILRDLKVGERVWFDAGLVSEREIAPFFKRYRETLAEERRMLFDRFKFVDGALKVVGVGSVGTRCFVGLFLAAPDDPLFLQIKEARPSVLEPYTGTKRVAHNGQRVVVGQRLMQSASNIFLGWSRGVGGHDFYVRQLRDMKVAPDVESQTPRVMQA